MGIRKTISILLLLSLPGINSFGQISPGDLSDYHAHLEGIANCTKCHILGQKVSNEKCLDCHTELKSRIAGKKGYHASSEILGRECVSCHSDHHGRNFEMIRFDEKAFNHKLTGYELEGAHAEQKCIACHKKEFIADQKIRDKKYTYLGLGTDCLACHADYHQNTLSSRCADCHGFNKFKPASGFDHSNTRFSLDGKHRDVECIKCHRIETRDGTPFQVFAGVTFSNCTSCHTDVHNNRFGQDCRQCHSEESFHVIKGMSSFDHSKTDYPLEGRHQLVKCSGCHRTKYTDPLRHDKCSECHTDYHREQFARQGSKPDCSWCHNTKGFSMTSFTIERHNEGAFVLDGAHLATPCIVCHKKDDRWEFRDIGIRCADCHQDLHRNYLDEKYYPEAKCTACHSASSWRDIMFDHIVTGWELKGSHKRQTCRACHFPETSPGRSTQRFKDLNPDCTTCHSDVHRGQFASNGRTDCSRCHGSDGWTPEGFDHNAARFILDGKHKDVACVKCHILVKEGETVYRKYKFEDISCEACHR